MSSFPYLWILKAARWSLIASPLLYPVMEKKHLFSSMIIAKTQETTSSSQHRFRFFVKSPRGDGKQQTWDTIFSNLSHLLIVLQSSGHSKHPSEDGKHLSPCPHALQGTAAQPFFSLTAPGHRFCLQNRYPLSPLILTLMQAILEELMEKN